jgi:hypothetical protein
VDLQTVAVGKCDSPFKGFFVTSVPKTDYVIEFGRVTVRAKNKCFWSLIPLLFLLSFVSLCIDR